MSPFATGRNANFACMSIFGEVQTLSSMLLVMAAVRCAPVAQSDRASDYGSGGWGFESSRARHVFFKELALAYILALAS